MAVYTKLKEEDINNILSNYSIGKLKSFKGIQEGIENTNYYLLVDEKNELGGTTIYQNREYNKIEKIHISRRNKYGYRNHSIYGLTERSVD